jgi:hypothetical protein
MTKISIEIFDDIISTLTKLQNINDTGIELEIPEGSILFENVLNLKLIRKHADRYGIVVHFVTSDVAGNNLIEMIEEGTGKFSENLRQNSSEDMELSGDRGTKEKFALSLPKLSMPKFILPILGNTSKSRIVPVLIALLIVGFFAFNQAKREAVAKIIINSQPLTRSITVKVKSGVPSDAEKKILAGTNVKNTLEVTKEGATTGTKLVGEKAEGKVKIFNNTDSDKKFKKGQVLVYEKDDKEFEFTTDEDVTVPAKVQTVPIPPTYVAGEIEVNATASVVGSAYNIDKGETLSVDGYKKADFSAASSNDFSGGKSESKKIVAEADIKKVSADIDAEITSQSSQSLASKVATSQALIAQSAKSTLIKETPNHKIGDEADTVSVTRTVEVEGLVYMKGELDRLLDALVKEFVPQGYVLSSKDRQLNVEVLGSSSNSVLTSTEADIQVTLKTFVVPDISEDNIKKQLAGKNTEEAKKILGSIQNIKTYEFKLNRGFIPFFSTVPKKLDQIKVEIVKE